jgi:two-component system OmpR family response regulator
MTGAEHILIVDDEPAILDLVQDYLEAQGFRVSTALDGVEMDAVLGEGSVELVLLDLTLPGDDGLTLARRLRDTSGVGIIMLTSRAELSDRVIGLETGADDYLPKPFHLRELLARVKSVMRRSPSRAAPAREGPTIAHFDGWRLDYRSRALTSPAHDDVRLTSGEFDLLSAFLAHANEVISRDRLLELARNRAGGPLDRTIDVQVGRLRRKLETDPQNPSLIKTVRGGGYLLTASVEIE